MLPRCMLRRILLAGPRSTTSSLRPIGGMSSLISSQAVAPGSSAGWKVNRHPLSPSIVNIRLNDAICKRWFPRGERDFAS
jgi:hypothetical protein